MSPSSQDSYPPFILFVWQMCPRKVLPSEDVDADPAGFYARKRGTTLSIQLTLTIVTLVSVLCHGHAGWARRTSFKWNGFFLVVAEVLALAHVCLTLSCLNATAGHLLKIAFFKAIIDVLIIVTAQLSLLSLYLRWWPPGPYWKIRRWIKWLIAYCVCAAPAWLIYPTAFCSTSWPTWDEHPKVCRNLYGGKESRLVVCTLAYLGIAMIPLSMTRGLKLPWMQRVAVIALLLLGLFPLSLFWTRMLMLIKCESSVFWVVYSDNVAVAEFSTAIMIVALLHSESLWRQFRPAGSLLYWVGANGEIAQKAAPVGGMALLAASGEDPESGASGDVSGPVESRPTFGRNTSPSVMPLAFTTMAVATF